MKIIFSDYEDDEFNTNFILTYSQMRLWRQAHLKGQFASGGNYTNKR
jgi:hypothetical protein